MRINKKRRYSIVIAFVLCLGLFMPVNVYAFNIHKKEQFMKTLQIIKQDQDKTISLVEHETSHTKYIQKELNYYDKTLYQTLQ